MKYMRYISWFLFLHLIWWGFTGMPLWGVGLETERKVILGLLHVFVFVVSLISWVTENDCND